MATIFDYVNANALATYYETVASNKIPYLGATLFPAKKQLGLDLSWIKGSGGLPVALKPSEFDTKATVRDRIGFKDIQTEMPFFREAMSIKEKERQQLNTMIQANNEPAVMTLVENIFDDETKLVDGGEVQAERMRMQLLSGGTIDISANRIAYQYDYKLSANNEATLTGLDMWSDTTNSNPVEDIKQWMDDVEDSSGVRPTRAVCTRKTWNYLIQNQKIKLDLNPTGGQNIIMTDSVLQQYLFSKLGIQVAVYNKKFIDEAGNSKLFYPDDKFTLFPEGLLGNTYYGTTPEESDLMNGSTDASVRIVNTGVAITTYLEKHPVNVNTVVSSIMLPSFERIDQIFVATVHA